MTETSIKVPRATMRLVPLGLPVPAASQAADRAPFPGASFKLAAGSGAARRKSIAACAIGASGSTGAEAIAPAASAPATAPLLGQYAPAGEGAAIHLDDSTMLLLRCIAIHEGLPGEKPEDTIFAIVRDVANTIGLGTLARAVANHRERIGLRPVPEDSS